MDLISEQDSGGADLGYRALVVDDEAPARSELRYLLDRDTGVRRRIGPAPQ
mgnify:CR=1 FL=1